jgi:hypothetical protein
MNRNRKENNRMNWTIEELLEELDGCGLIITDRELLKETLRYLDLSLEFSFKSDECDPDPDEYENNLYLKGQ